MVRRRGVKLSFPVCLLLFGVSWASGEPINALFELRNAASDPDTILNPGEVLHLEVYLTLSSAAAIPNLQAVSWFLQLSADEDNLLTFNNDFIDESGLSNPLVNQIDNNPVAGVLARAALSPGGIAYPNGQAQRIGRFSVTALNPGSDSRSATYTFADAPPQRPWVVDLAGQNETVDLAMLAGPTIEVLPSIACASIIQWRSVRSHSGDGELTIILNPAASGNGISGPNVESRFGSIRRVEIDLSCPAGLSDPSQISVTGWTTNNGNPGTPISYSPTSVLMLDADTLAILFDPGVLPTETCYTMSLGGGTLGEPLFGDTDVAIRSLTADTNGDGNVTLSDVLLTKFMIGPPQPVTANPQHDVNLSGGYINLGDVLFVKNRLTSPAMKAVCP